MQVIHLYGCLVIHAVFAVFFSQNAAAGAEHIGQGQLVIGQQYLNGAHTVCQNLVDLGQQAVQPVAGFGAYQQHIRVIGGNTGAVALVVDRHLRDIPAAQVVQHFISHAQLLGGFAVAGVGNFQDDVRAGSFFQCALKSIHQIMRQAADKADCIHQDHL